MSKDFQERIKAVNYRICRCYSPLVGNWYIIQKKVLFWWKTLPFAFDDLFYANQFLYIKQNKEEINITPLYFDEKCKIFDDNYKNQKVVKKRFKT